MAVCSRCRSRLIETLAASVDVLREEPPGRVARVAATVAAEAAGLLTKGATKDDVGGVQRA